MASIKNSKVVNNFQEEFLSKNNSLKQWIFGKMLRAGLKVKLKEEFNLQEFSKAAQFQEQRVQRNIIEIQRFLIYHKQNILKLSKRSDLQHLTYYHQEVESKFRKFTKMDT